MERARPRWVFFDVGNVLLDEDPLTYLSFLRHSQAVCRARPEFTFFDVLAAREAKAVKGSRWPLYEAISEVLSQAECAELWEATAREVRGRYAEISPLIPGAAEAVKQLGKVYRLGLIANQGPECRDRLEELGLLGNFGVIVFSEELGFYKPDQAMFLRAIAMAQSEPSECLMVGDRLDNDIVPASSIGMQTAWVRWPRRLEKGWKPDEPEPLAYLRSLEFLALQHKSSARISVTYTLDATSELVSRLARRGKM